MKSEKGRIIISKTITFILIFIFILLFKEIFGAENTLIGVTTITGALLFLERNLARRPFKYLVELIFVNITLGFLAYFAGVNFILAFMCSFIAMFFIGYIFTYEFRTNMYVPFGLQYVFMLAVPIDVSRIYNRTSALVFGAIFIMMLQILFNRDKVKKRGYKELEKLVKIVRRILEEKDEEKIKNLNTDFEKVSTGLKEIIYNSRNKGVYIEGKSRAILDMILFLKEIIYRKKELEESEEKIIVLKEIEGIFEGDKNFSILLENEYIDNNLDLKYICEILQKLNTKELSGDEKKEIRWRKRWSEIKKDLNRNSMRFRYAIKLSLSIGVTGSLIQYFDIFQGKWILFTILALVQPYSDEGMVKVRQRLEGSLLGALIAIALFSTIKNSIIQSYIVMLVGYLDCYHKTYREKMIYVTVSAIGASLILGGTFKMVASRVILIIIGILISIVFNKFVLPYSTEDAKRDLVEMYNENGEKMMSEIKGGNKEGVLETHYIIGALIEKKLGELNFSSNIKEKKKNLSIRYYNFKKGKREEA